MFLLPNVYCPGWKKQPFLSVRADLGFDSQKDPFPAFFFFFFFLGGGSSLGVDVSCECPTPHPPHPTRPHPTPGLLPRHFGSVYNVNEPLVSVCSFSVLCSCRLAQDPRINTVRLQGLWISMSVCMGWQAKMWAKSGKMKSPRFRAGYYKYYNLCRR